MYDLRNCDCSLEVDICGDLKLHENDLADVWSSCIILAEGGRGRGRGEGKMERGGEDGGRKQYKFNCLIPFLLL